MPKIFNGRRQFVAGGEERGSGDSQRLSKGGSPSWLSEEL